MALQDDITQLTTELGEMDAAKANKQAALDFLTQAQAQLTAAQAAESKETADVKAIYTRIRDEAQAKLDELGSSGPTPPGMAKAKT